MGNNCLWFRYGSNAELGSRVFQERRSDSFVPLRLIVGSDRIDA